MAGFDNNFPQGLQNLMQARRGLPNATPSNSTTFSPAGVLDKTQVQPQPFMAGSQPGAQIQQPQGGFGQQLAQQGQPQMIRAQLQGEIVSPQQQGMGGLGGGLGGGITPSMVGMLPGMGRGSVPPEIMKTMMSATPQPQQNQGLGGLAAYGPQAYKAGGSVEMRNIAQKLQDKGRGGDTILAHINPQEAGILSALGGSGTINPHTGLPEYRSLNPIKLAKKGLSKLDDVVFQPITHAVQNVVQDVAKATGPVGQIAASYFGGPIGAALYAGLSGEDGFNFKRGLMAGAMTWGAQNLAEGLGGTESAASSTPVPEPGLGSVGLEGSGLAAGDATASVGELGTTGGSTAMATPQPTVMGQLGSGNISGAMNTAGQNISNAASNAYDSVSSGISNAWNDPSSLIPKNALVNQDMGTVMNNAGKVLTGDTSAFTGSLSNSVVPMYVGSMGMKAADEMEQFKKEQEEIQAKQRADKERYMGLGLAELKKNPWMYAEGGAIDDEAGRDGLASLGSPINYAAGGATPPRFLSGGGDGMSDSIPATIDGKQPARIADGEFIIPADVVSHLGNGSSKAGAKQLYSMMDKVRAARTGTKKQGKQINPKKYLPA